MNTNMNEKLYLDDVTGTIGEWLTMDTSEIPEEALETLKEAYQICTDNL